MLVYRVALKRRGTRKASIARPALDVVARKLIKPFEDVIHTEKSITKGAEQQEYFPPRSQHAMGVAKPLLRLSK